MAGGNIPFPDRGFPWFKVRSLSDCLFHTRLPFGSDGLSVCFIRIGKRPPMSYVGHIVNRVTKQGGELLVYHLNLLLQPATDNHCNTGALHKSPAVIFAFAQCLFYALALADIADRARNQHTFFRFQRADADLYRGLVTVLV